MELIESGTISTPVEYLDIDLPSGYDSFVLRLVGVKADDDQQLAFALSPDGGTTFYNDLINYDSYQMGGVEGAANVVSPGVLSLVDAIGFITVFGIRTGYSLMSVIDIFPGAVGLNAMVSSHNSYKNAGVNDNVSADIVSSLLQEATGRQNVIRLLPYGNEDADPPTSGDHLTAGSYFLYGIPTP